MKISLGALMPSGYFSQFPWRKKVFGKANESSFQQLEDSEDRRCLEGIIGDRNPGDTSDAGCVDDAEGVGTDNGMAEDGEVKETNSSKMPKKSKELKKQKVSHTCQMRKIPKSKLHETLEVS